MTWVPHSAPVERQHDGTQSIDYDSVVGGTVIKLGIVTESVINPDTNTLFTGLTAVGTATAWTGPVTLANTTFALVTGDGEFDADDPAQIAQDAGGFTNGRSLVIYEDVNKFIICSHIAAAVFGNVAGPITITFNAAGILVYNI